MTMTIPTDGQIDLDALAELAERATPGPWYTAGPPWFQTGSGVLAGSPDPHAGYLIVDTEMWAGERDEYVENNPNGVPLADADADAAFVAAANPGTVLALIDLARRAAIPSEQGEAVAWDCADDAGIFCTTHVKTAAENIAAKGYTVTPLYHHPAPAAGVKVKALRWLDVGTPTELDLIAHTPFDTFHISRDDACEWPIILRPFITGQSNYQTVEEAKAAAQQDYEARILSALDQGEPLQQRVAPWMEACFGPEISNDRLERGDRLLEEVLELLQSGDYPKERIAALTDYTYGREKGDPFQEAGGVMITVAAYCLAHGLDMHAAGEAELARIWTKLDKIRAKQAAKPTGSALPIASPSPPALDGAGRDGIDKAIALLRPAGNIAYNMAAGAQSPNKDGAAYEFGRIRDAIDAAIRSIKETP